MKQVVWLLIVALIVLHQDFWFWNDGRLVFGFLPVGLAYHAGISLAASATWWLAVRFAWPVDPADVNPERDMSPERPEGDAA